MHPFSIFRTYGFIQFPLFNFVTITFHLALVKMRKFSSLFTKKTFHDFDIRKYVIFFKVIGVSDLIVRWISPVTEMVR